LPKLPASASASPKPGEIAKRYDFILDSGQRLWRVQVESSRHFDGSRYIVKLKGRAAYTAKEIDFIAVYIVPENLWYVIPISVAAHRTQMYVSPLRHPPFQA
jgi:hypothetical protein